jgi:hypothetical protein
MMRLELKGVIERGVANKERILLAVLTPANLSYYSLLHTVAADLNTNTVRAGGHLTYWFPTQWVGPRDQVIIYTRTGADNAVRRPDGGTNYFYYWGLNQTIFQDPSSRVVLFEHQSWQARR